MKKSGRFDWAKNSNKTPTEETTTLRSSAWNSDIS